MAIPRTKGAARMPINSPYFHVFSKFRGAQSAARALGVVVAMASGVGSATTALAAPESAAETAGRTLFNEAMGLLNAGRFSEACPKFEASFRQFPGIGTRGKLAECYEKSGRLATAYRTYRETYQLALKGGDAVRAQIALERAEALEPQLARYTIVSGPGPSARDVTVSRGRIPIERSTWSKPHYVDAGTLVFEFAAPKRVAQVTRVTIENGQSIEVQIPDLPLESGESEATGDEGATPDSAFTSPPEEPARGGTWQKPTAIAVGGLGVAGLAASAVFGIVAKTTYDDAFSSGACNVTTRQCSATGQATVEDARGQATLSTVFAVAGGALAATGIVLYLTAPTARSTALRVVPSAYGLAGGGLTLTGSL